MSRPGFPLDDEYFRGLSNVTKPTEGGLADLLNGLEGSAATCTTGELHLYADGTSGSDSNDGRSAATPKKTLQAVFALIPDIVKHPVFVNLVGTFSETGKVTLQKHLTEDAAIVLDGGSSVEIVDGPYTATSSSTTAITDSGRSWSTDQHIGRWVHINGGAQAGTRRVIHSGDATSLTVLQNWTSPGAVEYQVERPLTTLTASSTTSYISIETQGGNVVVQRLTFSGTKAYLQAKNCSSQVWACECCFETSYYYAMYAENSFGIRPYIVGYNPATGVWDLSTVGCGVRAGLIEMTGCKQAYIGYSVLRGVTLANTCITSIDHGTRIKGTLTLTNCAPISVAFVACLANHSGYQVTSVDNSPGVGIVADGSLLTIKNANISNHGSHGIEARNNSTLKFTDVATGSGNSGAGVYAHSGSVVHITNGSPPTLTGTVGDVTTDGISEKTTWANVDAGVKVSDADEMVVIKEV